MGRSTPWGNADTEYSLGCGLVAVNTPGHGGIYISDPSILPSDVTSTFANGRNWAEEDVEGCLVLALLYDKLDLSKYCPGVSKSKMIEYAKKSGEDYGKYSSILKHL